MKLITRNTDYAMRALCYIAERERAFVSAEEMVARLEIPRPFLRKILQILSVKGLLKSTKGQGGGFSLARSKEKIFLTDLMRIFQNVIRLNECVFKKKVCPNRSTCMLKKEIDSIEQDVLERLRGISIASLMRDGNGSHLSRKGKCHGHSASRH